MKIFKSRAQQGDGTEYISEVDLQINHGEFVAVDRSDGATWAIKGIVSSDHEVLAGLYSGVSKTPGTVLMKKTEQGYEGNYTVVLEDGSVHAGYYVWEERI